MANVITIDPIKDPRWDAFVENHPFGWICHLSGWKKVLETNFSHMKGHYLALVDNADKIQAGLPLFEIRSWLMGNRLVSIPFATLSDPLVTRRDDLQILLQVAKNLSRDLGASFLEIRTLNSQRLMTDPELSGNYHFKNHCLDLNIELEDLWKKFHRTQVRRNISRANRNGLTVEIGGDEKSFNEFYKLYMKTRKRLGLPLQPYPFLKSLFYIFGPTKKMVLCLVRYENQLIAGHVIFRFNGRVSAEMEGWDLRFNKMNPNHLLFWEEIKLAHKEGFRIYDFGRTSLSNSGLMEFKNHWGTKLVDLPVFYYPRMIGNPRSDLEKSFGYFLVSKICKIAPEATLQLIGRICYRHLN